MLHNAWQILGALALVCLAQAQTPSTETASDPASLLAALQRASNSQGAGNEAVVLQGSVSLSPADLQGARLPVQIGPGETLTLRGAEGTLPSLELGGTPAFFNVQGNGTLVLASLNLNGFASAPTAPPPGVETVIQGLPAWPTILSDPGGTIVLQDVNLTLPPSAGCTPAAVAASVAQFQDLTGDPQSVTADGLTGRFADFSIPLPVLSATNGSALGTVKIVHTDTNITCVPLKGEPAASPPPPTASDSGGGGTPGWVWAIVGVGVALAVAAVAGAGLLWRRKRKRRRQEQIQGGEENGRSKALVSADMESGKSQEDTGSPSGGTASLTGNSQQQQRQQQQTGQSGLAVPPQRQSSGVLPETVWRSRVGVIDDLELKGSLGRGAFGVVFAGLWKGTPVAVKVCATHVAPGESVDLGREPLLSMALSHPNVLTSYRVCVVRLLPDMPARSPDVSAELSTNSASPAPDSPVAGAGRGASLSGGDAGGSSGTGATGSSSGSARLLKRPPLPAQSSSELGSGHTLVPSLKDKSKLVEVMPMAAVLEPGLFETWLITELCDKGSLADALAARRFVVGDPPRRDMATILLCLLDVARGLEYLHGCGVLHGDLKPQNVLLKSSRTTRRGFLCKLCDFGLARLLGETQTHVDTGSYGTATHAAPELLMEGRLTRASDVYAMGVLMQEMVAGERAFRGLMAMQVICLVTRDNYRPPISPDCPPRLADLIARCWHPDPQARPQISAVAQELHAIHSSLQAAS